MRLKKGGKFQTKGFWKYPSAEKAFWGLITDMYAPFTSAQQEIIQGITVVDSIRVFSINIDRPLLDLNNNWNQAILKMRRLCGFWGNFGLSTSGRVMAVPLTS